MFIGSPIAACFDQNMIIIRRLSGDDRMLIETCSDRSNNKRAVSDKITCFLWLFIHNVLNAIKFMSEKVKCVVIRYIQGGSNMTGTDCV
jgi:hypothetical protein